MIACQILVRMMEIAQMELMNTAVPVFMDTLEHIVKQVSCCGLNYKMSFNCK